MRAAAHEEQLDAPLLDALLAAAMKSTVIKPSIHSRLKQHYCSIVERYQVNTPRSAFPRILHSDLPLAALPVKVARSLGWFDPVGLPKKHPGWRHALPSVQLFWFRSTHRYSRYGTGFPCRGQVAKYLPGCEYAGSKSALVTRLKLYAKAFSGHSRHCFDRHDMHPLSHRLNVRSECLAFLRAAKKATASKSLNSSHVQWIFKVGEGVQNARGLTLHSTDQVRALVRDYEAKDLCTERHLQSEYNVVAQRYITNPLLVRGKKFDFRVYLYVASADPLLAFFFPGFARVSPLPYDASVEANDAHFTNIARAKEQENYATDEEFRASHVMSFEELQDYLYKEGITNDPRFVHNDLKPVMKRHMVHLLNAVDKDIEKWSGRFAVWGVDFLLDTDLKLWLLEVNTAPNLNTGAGNRATEGLKFRLLREAIEVQEVILQSGVAGLANFDFEHLEPLLHRRYEQRPGVRHTSGMVNRSPRGPSLTNSTARQSWSKLARARRHVQTYNHDGRTQILHRSNYLGNLDGGCIRATNTAVTRRLNVVVHQWDQFGNYRKYRPPVKLG